MDNLTDMVAYKQLKAVKSVPTVQKQIKDAAEGDPEKEKKVEASIKETTSAINEHIGKWLKTLVPFMELELSDPDILNHPQQWEPELSQHGLQVITAPIHTNVHIYLYGLGNKTSVVISEGVAYVDPNEKKLYFREIYRNAAMRSLFKRQDTTEPQPSPEA